MHQYDACSLGPGESRAGVGLATKKIVESADPGVLEGRRQSPIPIDQYLDPTGFEGPNHAISAIPVVVISQDCKAAQGRGYSAQEWRQPLDVAGIERNEVTTKQQHVRFGELE